MEEIKSFNAYQKVSELFSKKLNEPKWLREYRKQALYNIEQLKPPKIDRVYYSNWNLWEVPNISLAEKTKMNRLMHPSEHEEVFIADFQEAILKNEALFRKCYKKSSFFQANDYFDAFTMAFLTDSLFIYIPENKKVIRPLELVFKQESDQANRQVLIYAGANSSIEIIENYVSDLSANKTSTTVHIELLTESGAKIHYSSLDQLSVNNTAFFKRRARTANDSENNLALGMLNAGDSIEDVQIELEGQGSTSDVKAVAITNEKQVQVSNVKITNIGKNTVANIFQHGVALDESTLTFNGIGHILNQSKNSQAQQESRVLMLSDDARADANPILLIDEFEVQAGHAASVSRVNQEQLYYLMSRGLKEKQAEKLIIRGFLCIVLSEISVQEVRNELIRTIERKLIQYGD